MIVAFVLAIAQISVGTQPSVPIAASNEFTNIVFHPVSSTTAKLTVQSGASAQTIDIKGLDDTLALLADKRLSAVWPEIMEWAGPELVKLRDSSISAAQAIYAKGRTKDAETSLGSIVRPELRGTFLLADALLNAGRIDEATRLIESVRGTAPRKDRWGPIEWTATSTWLSKAQQVQGNVSAAIAILEASILPMGADRTKLNLEVNRAALLLEVDRAAEALTAIEGVQASFAAPGIGGLFTSNPRVGGSDRQFAWIRSCALSKLGRATEAAAAAAPLNGSAEPKEKRFVIDPTIRLRAKWARCTGNVTAAAQAYTDALRTEPVGGDALLELQPALNQPTFDQVFLEKVRQDPA
ncbi:MAG: hypothetical protein EOO77_36555, partial [Oxalobacteraceae bacterium]